MYDQQVTIREAVRQIENGKYLLPVTQREIVWERDQITDLFDFDLWTPYSFILKGVVILNAKAPSYVSRGPNLDEDLAALLIERTRNNPAKPWTIVSNVANENNEDPEAVRETLRQLTLQGKLTPNADGDLRAAKDLVAG